LERSALRLESAPGGGPYGHRASTSSERGVGRSRLAETAMPSRLVQLALEHDRVLTY